MRLHDTRPHIASTTHQETALKTIRSMYIEEQTASELLASTKRTFPKTRREITANTDADIRDVTITGNMRQKFVLARFKVQGKTDSYNTSIKIDQANLSDDEFNPSIEIMQPNGDPIFVEPANVNSKNVKLRCSCKDFIWRFSRQDAKVTSLNGPTPTLPYKGVRPSVNPTWAPGACKHLHKAIDHLMRLGVLK